LVASGECTLSYRAEARTLRDAQGTSREDMGSAALTAILVAALAQLTIASVSASAAGTDGPILPIDQFVAVASDPATTSPTSPEA